MKQYIFSNGIIRIGEEVLQTPIKSARALRPAALWIVEIYDKWGMPVLPKLVKKGIDND